VTEVQSFIGFINFYQSLSEISRTSPNHSINSQEGRRVVMAEEEQGSFEELKCLIMSTLILVQPNQDVPFRLETDASGYAPEQSFPVVQ